MSHEHSHSCCSGDHECGNSCHHHSGCDCCCHSSCHTHHQDFAAELLALADEAWMEVLKEKIKDHIRESSGKKLDELAKLVSESNGCRWKSKMCLQNGQQKFREDIEHFFKK